MLTRREAVELIVREDPYYQLERFEIAGVPWRVYRAAMPSLRAIFQSTTQFGDREFLVYGDERLTFAEHYRLVAGLASRWAVQGVQKGDRVAIAMRNYPEWVMTFWAVQALGAIAVPLNAWWTGAELAYALRDSSPKILVADGERLRSIGDQLPDLKIDQVVAVRSWRDLIPGAVAWDDELASLDLDSTLPDVAISPDDDATIMYTSGTTGLPKGAIASQRNHATNLRNTELNGAAALKMIGASLPVDLPQTSVLQTFPFFHIGGLSGLYSATGFGAKLCLMYKWNTEEAVKLIEQEKINAVAMVPTLLRRLLEYADNHGSALPTVAGMASGGAPVPPDLIRQMEGQFDRRVSPANGYGLTETTSAVTINSGAEYSRHPESVGRLVPGADMRSVDPDSGQDRAVGEIGELWFRGPNIVRGYWNKPEETAAAFTDGWFHTGDLGYIDGEGLVYVVDRLKDVIIRSGENVYCAEVEAVIFEDPTVADVAVIGLPHPSWGEEVVAIVERQPGTRVKTSTLQQHIASRLARFKVPTQIIFTEEPLPRTATGKVLKRELRERYADSSTART
ncbi:MAG TPA: class I adenylate-forming enzyme family protein [Acidimicrobiales bacterium]|nr:class I adenylate-forming enzyme family protein [Acidimicrobiales bacterium]